MIQARPYQQEAQAAVFAAEARGLRRVVVALPTGGGKTVVAAHILAQRPGRALFLAHRDELLRQAADKIRMVDHAADVGVVKADEDDVHARTVVASVQTLARPRRLERFMRSLGGSLLRAPEPLRTVFVDECHHSSAASYLEVLHGLGCFDDAAPLTIGLTATPERADGKRLADVWQEIVYQLGILDGIAAGWLVELRAKQIKLSVDFSRLHVRAGEFRDEESAELLMEADAPGHAARAYIEHAAGRKAVVFTPTVAVAKAMAAAFCAAGVPAESVDGEMPMDERRAVLARLSAGETRVVANAQVLTEGWDSPSVACAIMARPTRSRPLAIQMIGRVLRPHPGKADALVLDLVGSATRMDLVTVASLFDVAPDAAERGVMAATQAKAAASAGPAAPPADGRLIAVDVSLFKARDFAWVDAHGRFVLSLGAEGHVMLEPAEGPDLWDVYQVKRVRVSADGARFPRYAEERRKLYSGLTIGYASGAAEDYVRKAGASVLNAKDAGWRKAPPSERQIEILKRRRRWREGMTRGEASDALTQLYAAR